MNDRPYVDEIFAGLVIDRGIDTELLKRDLQGRFVTRYYPSRGLTGTRTWSIPPDFPQFKGRKSKKDEVWFDRLYLDQDQIYRAQLETKPSGAWLYIEKNFSEDEIEKAIGRAARELVKCRPFPDHILVKSIENIFSGDSLLSKVTITQPEMVPLPVRITTEEILEGDDTPPSLIDDEGRVYKDIETFISLTHVPTDPWEDARHFWKKDGVRIEPHEVAHVDLVNHRTPGVIKPLSAISIKVPYDPEKVSIIGPAPRTFFDRANSAWMIPMPISPILAGRILAIYSLIVLPDGRFFRSCK